MTEEQPNNNQVLGPNIILFILSIVIIANVDKKVFDEIDYQTYYNLIAMMLYSTVAIFISSIVLCLSIVCADNTCCKLIQLIVSSLPLLFLILFMVFIGMIWHHDPNHTVLFYPEFWTEWAFKVHDVNNKEIFYHITDVLIRIYSTLALILSFVLPCCLFLFCATKVNKPSPSLRPGMQDSIL